RGSGQVLAGPSGDITPAARSAVVLAIAVDDLPAGEHSGHATGHRRSPGRSVIDVHPPIAHGQGVLRFVVVQDDVGITARRDRALTRVQSEHARGGGTGQLNPTTPANMAMCDRMVQQVDPVLHTGYA